MDRSAHPVVRCPRSVALAIALGVATVPAVGRAALGRALEPGAATGTATAEPPADPGVDRPSATTPPAPRVPGGVSDGWAGTEPPPARSDEGGDLADRSDRPAGYVLAPTHRGTGLLVTAGLLGAAALAEHAVALAAFRNTCGLAEDGIEQFQDGDGQDPQMQAREVVEIGAFAVLCTVSIGPALTLRAVVPVFLGGSLAVAAGGGHLRGTYLGYRDTFVRPRTRKEKVALGLGGALVALGGTIWLGSRLSMLRNRVGCDSITCLAGYDFATLHLSAALSISGAATLGLGLAYRTSRRRFLRLEELHVVPLAGRAGGGLGLSGRF